MYISLKNGTGLSVFTKDALRSFENTLDMLNTAFPESTASQGFSPNNLFAQSETQNYPVLLTPSTYVQKLQPVFKELLGYFWQIEKAFKINKIAKRDELKEPMEACYHRLGQEDLPHIVDDYTYIIGLNLRLFFQIALDTDLSSVLIPDWIRKWFDREVKIPLQEKLPLLEQRLRYYQHIRGRSHLAEFIESLEKPEWEKAYYLRFFKENEKPELHFFNYLEYLAKVSERKEELQKVQQTLPLLWEKADAIVKAENPTSEMLEEVLNEVAALGEVDNLLVLFETIHIIPIDLINVSLLQDSENPETLIRFWTELTGSISNQENKNERLYERLQSYFYLERLSSVKSDWHKLKQLTQKLQEKKEELNEKGQENILKEVEQARFEELQKQTLLEAKIEESIARQQKVLEEIVHYQAEIYGELQSDMEKLQQVSGLLFEDNSVYLRDGLTLEMISVFFPKPLRVEERKLVQAALTARDEHQARPSRRNKPEGKKTEIVALIQEKIKKLQEELETPQSDPKEFRNRVQVVGSLSHIATRIAELRSSQEEKKKALTMTKLNRALMNLKYQWAQLEILHFPLRHKLQLLESKSEHLSEIEKQCGEEQALERVDELLEDAPLEQTSYPDDMTSVWQAYEAARLNFDKACDELREAETPHLSLLNETAKDYLQNRDAWLKNQATFKPVTVEDIKAAWVRVEEQKNNLRVIQLKIHEKLSFQQINEGLHAQGMFQNAWRERTQLTLPFPFAPEQSCFNQEEVNLIMQQINHLHREIHSCWPYPNKDRKKAKIAGLLDLLFQSTEPEIKATDVLAAVQNKYPHLIDGHLSTRTADLLNILQKRALQNSLPAHS